MKITYDTSTGIVAVDGAGEIKNKKRCRSD